MAKVYRDLYPQLIRFDNLWQAFGQAAKGKRGKPVVAAFELELEANLLRLQRGLADHSYRPGDYYSFYIRDPKHRLISAAPFCDRVVHHALCDTIEPPIFTRTYDLLRWLVPATLKFPRQERFVLAEQFV